MELALYEVKSHFRDLLLQKTHVFPTFAVSIVHECKEFVFVWGKIEDSEFISRVSEIYSEFSKSKINFWAFLVAQWLRICLPVQGTRIRALVWEDPKCRGTTRPVSHSY